MNLNYKWKQHPDNPLIEPVWPEWLLGDPVVLPPEKSPDGKWHMFLNTVLFVYRYTSRDGVKWSRKQRVCRGMRAYVFEENGTFYLFYELHKTPKISKLMVRRSKDLKKWGRARKVLSPELEWETDNSNVVSCPCVIKINGKYRLYYSTSQVFLKDLGFSEPKYISFAESSDIFGPYEKRAEPLMGPEKDNPYKNLGAGAIKIYRDDEEDRWVGFNNGVYDDKEGRSRSAIEVLTSKDGIEWEEALDDPVISPDKGWRKALVYQLDAVPRPNGELWLYYNCRDGWKKAKERIGLEIGTPVK